MADMDHDYIDEHGIIERYVKRHLDPELERDFEIHMLDCDHCIDEIEVVQLLQQGLRADVAHRDARREPPTAEAPGWLAWLLPARPGLAVAALLLVALVPAATVYWTLGGSGAASVDALLVRDDARMLSLAPVRSAGERPSYRLELGDDPFPVFLMLEVEPTDCDRYAAEVVGPESTVLWQGDDLFLNAYDSIPLIIESSLLAPGDHRFEVRSATSCESAGQPVASYGLRVLP